MDIVSGLYSRDFQRTNLRGYFCARFIRLHSKVQQAVVLGFLWFMTSKIWQTASFGVCTCTWDSALLISHMTRPQFLWHSMTYLICIRCYTHLYLLSIPNVWLNPFGGLELKRLCPSVELPSPPSSVKKRNFVIWKKFLSFSFSFFIGFLLEIARLMNSALQEENLNNFCEIISKQVRFVFFLLFFDQAPKLLRIKSMTSRFSDPQFVWN